MLERTLVSECDIRPATVADATDVVYLTQRAYSQPYRPGTPVTFVDEDEESIARDLDHGWKILVAHHGGLAVGAVRVRMEEKGVRVAKLAVDPRYRRRGIGTMLLSAAEQIASPEGARSFHGEVLVERNMVSFFERVGYTPRAERTAGPLRFVELTKGF